MDAGRAIIAEFVEPGVARMIYRQFPVVGRLSAAIAEASECAVDQRRFWAFHDAVFARLQRRAMRGEDDITAAAREARLDLGALAACRREGQVRARVEADFNAGTRLGVEATPTIVINGQKIVGNQPLEVFRAQINAARRP
jgi:protein-disulfide isomerase